MKLVGKHIDKAGAGYVNLRPEDDEDMWHLYNIIQNGDLVRAPAIRSVHFDTNGPHLRVQNVSPTGTVDSQRIRTNLTIRVVKVEFSAAASSGNFNEASAGQQPNSFAALHISGRVAVENAHVKMNAFHTLDIEVGRDVRVEKDEWDSIALATVQESCIPGRGAEVGAIVCGEGIAAFCLLSQHMTVVRQRIDVSIPRKMSSSSSAHEKGLARFYDAVYTTFLRLIPYASASLRAIVVASPGWVKDSVMDYIFKEATRTGNKALLAVRNKFIKIHVNSPHVHSLTEVLKSPEVTTQLKETKFAREGIMLDKFFKMLGSDEMRAWYGPDHVRLAADRGAVGTLLISDQLFRASDPKERKRYVALVEDIQKKGGEVFQFSSMHESGQQLNQLTGIAAILTFPLDVEVVEMEEREAKEQAASEAGELIGSINGVTPAGT